MCKCARAHVQGSMGRSPWSRCCQGEGKGASVLIVLSSLRHCVVAGWEGEGTSSSSLRGRGRGSIVVLALSRGRGRVVVRLRLRAKVIARARHRHRCRHWRECESEGTSPLSVVKRARVRRRCHWREVECDSTLLSSRGRGRGRVIVRVRVRAAETNHFQPWDQGERRKWRRPKKDGLLCREQRVRVKGNADNEDVLIRIDCCAVGIEHEQRGMWAMEMC